MSQQAPKQRPPRPQPPQEGYPPQNAYPPQQPYQNPQGYPQQGYQQMPPQAAPVPQARGGNPLLTGIKWILWPFLKVAGWILGLINVIIHELLRSTVRMIFGLLVFAVIIALGIAYFMALRETGFDFSAAVPVMIENIQGLFGLQ